MPEKKSRPKSLQQVLDNIRSKRDLRIGALSEFSEEVGAISTGNIFIDQITGVGGLPRGRITELYGLQSSGKTTTALQTAAEAQKMGLRVLYLDFEQAVDKTYARALGLDMDSDLFLFGQPTSFEDGINSAREIIQTGEVGMVIVDSVASMVLDKELENETGDMKVSARDKARVMAQAMRQLAPIVKANDVAVVFLNHVQDIIPTGHFEQQLASRGVKRTTTPGGSALKFFASLRMEYKPIGSRRGRTLNPTTNEYEDQLVETNVRVTVVKNKVAPPFGTADVRVRFGRGFSQAASALQVLTAHNVIRKEAGGKHTFDEDTAPPWMDLEKKNWMKGEEEILTRLEASPEWLAHLTAMAQTLMHGSGPAPVEVPGAETTREEGALTT